MCCVETLMSVILHNRAPQDILAVAVPKHDINLSGTCHILPYLPFRSFLPAMTTLLNVITMFVSTTTIDNEDNKLNCVMLYTSMGYSRTVCPAAFCFMLDRYRLWH